MPSKLSTRLAVGGLTLTAAFWSLFFLHGYLQQTARDVASHSRRPFLLNGLHIGFDRYLASPLRVAQSSRYLVLVSSDTCPYSHEEVGPWTELIKTLPFMASDAVLLLTMHGRQVPTELAASLERRGVRHQIVELANRSAFVESTGLVSTPSTIVLGTDLRVKMVANRVDQDALAYLNHFYQSNSLDHSHSGETP